MIYCILGKSCSGKDTIARQLSEQLNIPIITSYTTREKRANEVNGREHWFITDEEADKLLLNNVLAYTEIGKYRYFALEPNVKDYIYIIDPNGLKELKSKNKEVRVIYIYCSDEIREERAKKRSDYNKFKKRCEDENERFKEFEENEEYIKIVNEGRDVWELIKYI